MIFLIFFSAIFSIDAYTQPISAQHSTALQKQKNYRMPEDSPSPKKSCPHCKKHRDSQAQQHAYCICPSHNEIYFNPLVLTELAHHLLKTKHSNRVTSNTCCPKCSEPFDPQTQRTCDNCSIHELVQFSLEGITYVPGTDILLNAIRKHFSYTIHILLKKEKYCISHTIHSPAPGARSALELASHYEISPYLKNLILEHYTKKPNQQHSLLSMISANPLFFKPDHPLGKILAKLNKGKALQHKQQPLNQFRFTSQTTGLSNTLSIASVIFCET